MSGQPTISFGMAKISLGMTVREVEQNLAGAGRHLQMLGDKETAIVYRNGTSEPEGDEGQVTFYDGRVAFAQFQMPNARTAEDLALEIAAAVDSMETKQCEVSNFAGHGTGGEHSESIVECGGKRFEVTTFHELGSQMRFVNVGLAIGSTVAQ